MQRLKILIWHIHGSYLNTLARIDADWYLPVKVGRPEGYGGRGPTFDLPSYVREVPEEQVRDLQLDLIIYQTPKNYFEDQFEILSAEQRQLPKIYLEHNTPKPNAVDTRHPIDDPDVLLVHVTHYNRLMWDNGRTPTIVIEHSVAIDPSIRYSGHIERGITVINGAEYRFLFSPIRYTSLPLAVIEAMTIGMPVVALATTELPTVIENGVTGYVSCDIDRLINGMQFLLANPQEARQLGARARAVACERFGLDRFIRDWNRAFALCQGTLNSRATASEM